MAQNQWLKMRFKSVRVVILFATTMSLSLAAIIAVGDPAPTAKWLTGTALSTQLQSRVSVSWTNAPLKESLNNFATANRVCIVLDRRIDPDQPFEFEVRDTKLEDVLSGVAAKLKSGVSLFGPLVYIGPANVASKLRTLAALRTEELRTLPTDIQKKWLAPRTLAWTKPTNPREVMATILKNANEPRLVGAPMPSDLWAVIAWPTMNSIEQLTLLLAEFDLTFQISSDGRTLTFIPIPEKVAIRKEYSPPNAADLNAKLKSLNLRGSQQIAGTKLIVDSTVEEHQLVQQLVSGKPAAKTTTREGEARYTLTIKLPVRDLAKGLAPKLGVTFTFDDEAIEAAKITLDQKIDLQVTDATLEQLLDAIFKPAGLQYEKQDGKGYTIRPAK
jgi:hypothetical protein